MIAVELVFATEDQQVVLELDLKVGTTIGEAVALSGIQVKFPGYDIASLRKGVWGELKPDDYQVVSGDRIEIYRPLITDPKEARRKRAGLAR